MTPIIKNIPDLPAGANPADHPEVVRPRQLGDQTFENYLAMTDAIFPRSIKPTTAPQLLRKAEEIMNARAREYDKPEGERSVGAVVVALNAILGREALSESEGWLFMTLLKQVRLFSAKSYHADSGLDGIAYQALLAEAKAKEG